jgi:hypothetical protein
MTTQWQQNDFQLRFMLNPINHPSLPDERIGWTKKRQVKDKIKTLVTALESKLINTILLDSF